MRRHKATMPQPSGQCCSSRVPKKDVGYAAKPELTFKIRGMDGARSVGAGENRRKEG